MASWYVGPVVAADDAARVKLNLKAKRVALGLVLVVVVLVEDSWANRCTCPEWHRENAVLADILISDL